MKNRIMIFLYCISFSLMASAQASGGYIRRNAQKPAKKVNRAVSRNYTVKESTNNVATSYDGKKFKYETTQIVDLGLPSGTLWAGWNIGASAPTEEGDRYVWGGIYSYITNDWQFYFDTDKKEKGIVYFKNYKINTISSIISSDRDVAHVKWGSPWKMPSKAQVEELLSNCDIYEVNCKDISSKCVLFRGPNGKCILFPSLFPNSRALCWIGELDLHYNLSNMAYVLTYDGRLDSELRCNGIYVRAVK